jgi:enoyl-[acyl-carrier protein] reductase II
MSNLLNLLGSRYPIIQGPIGHINSPRLVAAICEAGALGMKGLHVLLSLPYAISEYAS